MLVKSNLDNLKIVPLVKTEETKKFQVRRSQVMLFPGVNEVDNDEFEVIRVHIKTDLDSKRIEILSEKSHSQPGQKAEETDTLVKVAAKKAVALVKETTSPESLSKWLDTEVRDEVRVAIKNRIEELDLNLSKD